jgi:ferredoxin, 2Fe-2S
MPKVTILPDGLTVDVEPGTSLLAASRQAGALHGSACGGVCACSSCHVHVLAGLDSLGEPAERELDILERAFGVSATSRLGCQATVGEKDVTFEVTRESLQTWLDEHPEERQAVERGDVPASASPELQRRLRKLSRQL